LSFVAVCECGSFTRAAERVFLSRSTVSQQVRRLEEMLGKALLERSSHQVLLTEEGEKLLGYARRIIGPVSFWRGHSGLILPARCTSYLVPACRFLNRQL